MRMVPYQAMERGTWSASAPSRRMGLKFGGSFLWTLDSGLKCKLEERQRREELHDLG